MSTVNCSFLSHSNYSFTWRHNSWCNYCVFYLHCIVPKTGPYTLFEWIRLLFQIFFYLVCFKKQSLQKYFLFHDLASSVSINRCSNSRILTYSLDIALKIFYHGTFTANANNFFNQVKIFFYKQFFFSHFLCII